MTSALHEMARKYAAAGIRIFPCVVGGKQPACKNGFYDATTDLDQIDAWWSRADYNLAFCPDDAGLFVIDRDPGAAESDDPPTYRTRTPRGGTHDFYLGSGPSTAGKLGPHIDTRGVGGYCLLPPSCINGKYYTVERDLDYQPIPKWVIKALRATDAPLAANVDTLDLVQNIDRAKKYLATQEGVVEGVGQNSDPKTYKLAGALKDLGLSEETAFDLMWKVWVPKCSGVWTEEWVRSKIHNVFMYGQNEPGAYAVPGTEEAFGEAVKNLTAGQQDEDLIAGKGEGIDPDLVKYFRGREPDEDEAMPDSRFLDEEKTLPIDVEGGCSVVAYGDYGCMKTTLALADAFSAIAKGRKAVLGAGEGVHGIRKVRVPAYCQYHGITTKDLRGKFRTCPAVPNLTSQVEVASFIEAFREFRPDIVILDTLATASAGVDENSDAIGKLLTSTGPIGAIRRAFNCTVILLHHTGKDDTRGPRGHSSIGGNADVLWKISADKVARTITKKVEKMRDGEDGFSVEYKVTPPAQVPVACVVGRMQSTTIGETNDLLGMATASLQRAGINSETKAIATPGVARLMLELEFPELRGDQGRALTDAQRQRQEALERKLKRSADKDNRFAHLAKKLGSHKNAPWMWSLPYHNRGPE